jgi:hypothetical protein
MSLDAYRSLSYLASLRKPASLLAFLADLRVASTRHNQSLPHNFDIHERSGSCRGNGAWSQRPVIAAGVPNVPCARDGSCGKVPCVQKPSSRREHSSYTVLSAREVRRGTGTVPSPGRFSHRSYRRSRFAKNGTNSFCQGLLLFGNQFQRYRFEPC